MSVRQKVIRGSVPAAVVLVCLCTHPGLAQSNQRVPWTHLSSTKGQIPAPDVGRQVATLILDIDKNGVNDFVVASYEKMAWFRRAAEGWTRYAVENGAAGVRMEAGGDFLDLDGDGDLDILMAAQSKAGEIWWWENPYPDFAPDKPWKRYQVIAVGGTHHDQIFGDFDGDGKTELAFWYNVGDQLYLAEIPTDPTKPWPVTLIAQLKAGKQHPEGFAGIDLNGDGKLDIVGGGYWFEHVEGTTFKAHPVDEEYRFSRSAAGDLIEGGRPEIVICSGDGIGPLALYKDDGGKWIKHVLIERVDHGHTLRVGDIDGDGHLDIYAAEMYDPGSGASCRQWVLYGDGKGRFQTQLLSTGIGCHESRIGDLDGDGDIDILQKDFQHDRRVDVWLNRTKDPKVSMPDTSKMNILFIIAEDWSANTPGCYGNPICKTPNLDRFATSAVRFDSAYVQAVCCNPSRTSFLTGLRPLTSRVWNNSQVMSERLPPGTVTLPELLKKKGFYTAVIGKFFHTVEYAEKQLLAFDRIESYAKPSGWEGPGPILKFPPVKRAPRDPAPKDQKSKAYREWRARNSDRYGDSGLAPEEEGDYRNAQIACALLKEFAQTKKQFFLSVHQSRPHTPLVAPKKYIDMYDPAKIPDPPAPPNVQTSLYPRRIMVGNPDIFMNRQPTPQQVKEAIAAYYACVSFIDSNIGMVLDELETQGLAQNTIVFIMGDHGFHLGDHGFWSKYSMLESTRRAPLWVRVPGAPANGRVCREFVEFVDFVPTVGELAGLDLPANLEGLSFVPLLSNPSRPWKKAVFMVENETNQVVRTRQFSYLEFGKGPVPAALFDLEKDPWETVNLADDPAYANTRQEMAQLLRTGWKAALPGPAASK